MVIELIIPLWSEIGLDCLLVRSFVRWHVISCMGLSCQDWVQEVLFLSRGHFHLHPMVPSLALRFILMSVEMLAEHIPEKGRKQFSIAQITSSATFFLHLFITLVGPKSQCPGPAMICRSITPFNTSAFQLLFALQCRQTRIHFYQGILFHV